VERELLLTGIGGQGVQLAAQIVARAAVLDGREVMLFGSYGGMMRGGNTDATIVVGDGPVLAPPTVPSAWAAIVMHHDYWSFVQERLRGGSVVLVNSTVFRGDVDRDDVHTIAVPATDLAVDVGNIMAASVVMIGALAGLTGLVSLDALVDAVPEALPPYRTKHIALNQEALRAGFAAVDRDVHPAWPARVTTGGAG
jgi:2-oxoacid:acceptor oxidoreductase gamma subunit (pyruvate/2-ketoisovalerate family)